MSTSHKSARDVWSHFGGPASSSRASGSFDGMEEVRRAIDAIRFSGDFPPAAEVRRAMTMRQIRRLELAETVRVEGRVPVAFLSWLEGLKDELGEHRHLWHEMKQWPQLVRHERFDR
jgi:hypothetical protein